MKLPKYRRVKFCDEIATLDEGGNLMLLTLTCKHTKLVVIAQYDRKPKTIICVPCTEYWRGYADAMS